MVAFVPISPTAARRLLQGVSAEDEGVLLSDFVEAGVIRAYARVLETCFADGASKEVRDAQIPRDLWKRIVAEGRVEQLLATSSVKLDDDGRVGGLPAVSITGVRFNEGNVRDVAMQHGDAFPETPIVMLAAQPVSVAPVADEALIQSAPEQQTPHPAEPIAAIRRPQRTGLPDDAVMVSIKEAMDILDVSRGTIGNLVKRGVLEDRKVGARTLIVAESIRSILKGE